MLIINSPTPGKRIQVFPNHFEEQMDWHNAEKSCNELEKGWRLPTKDELKLMYEQLHRKGIGNFKASLYWSGSESGKEQAWYFVFGSGGAINKRNKTVVCNVRPVRSL